MGQPEQRQGHVAILGAGPVGLDAALAAADAGWDLTVYEASSRPGGNVRGWGHVGLFTPWDLDVSPRMARHLAAAGREVPSGPACPDGRELAERLLDPLAELPEVAARLRLGARVVAVGRQALLKNEEIATPGRAARPFRLLVDHAAREEVASASIVLDCSGAYGNPLWLGDGGIPAPGERAVAHRVERSVPDLQVDADAWAGRTILLVGSGHSAQTAARQLAALARSAPGTKLIWAVRRSDPTWQAVADDPLPERAALVAEAERLASGEEPAVELRREVVVDGLAPEDDGRVRVTLRGRQGSEDVLVDRVLALTGSVGDNSLYRQLQVHECYATDAPIQLSAALLGADAGDCLEQTSHGVDVLRNPEPNFFILGSKSYGRQNSTFLMRVGWQQVDEVFAALAEEDEAA